MTPPSGVLGFVVSIAGCCLAACGPLGMPHPVNADPHSLVISVADLPGWQADSRGTGPISNPRDMTGDSSDVSPFTDNGWVRAYEADFVASSTNGAQGIAVLVSVFGDPAGAKTFFLQGIGGQDEPGAQALSHPPSLGERSKIFRGQVDTTSRTGVAVWYWFYWQDRNVFVRVLVKGPPTAESEAVSIARREAHVIQQH